MYELHNLIEKLQERKTKFKSEYTEEEDLIQVRDVLNKRLVTLKNKLIEDPSNQSNMLEYGFLQDEVMRINKRLIDVKEKYSTKEAKIEKYDKLINYNIQELFTYVDFIKQFKIDDKLYQAMQDSLVSLDRNINKLNELRKEDDSQ
ncbi:MAG: hypothetical protein BZ135_01430 [Methanosphaera sp. rholeuAM6]|nr:MAG: hypothetical protein BZ135_01430 [Methanosphaera sp. rholeuAM6]